MLQLLDVNLFLLSQHLIFVCQCTLCCTKQKKITFLVRIKVGINNFCFGLFESFKRKKMNKQEFFCSSYINKEEKQVLTKVYLSVGMHISSIY
jgi:hypothetical protein